MGALAALAVLIATQATGLDWKSQLAKKVVREAAREGIEEAVEDAAKDVAFDAALGAVPIGSTLCNVWKSGRLPAQESRRR